MAFQPGDYRITQCLCRGAVFDPCLTDCTTFGVFVRRLFLDVRAVYPRTALGSEMQLSSRVPIGVRVQNRLSRRLTLEANAGVLLSI